MFQFRRFPTYAYFIQRRLTEYCSAGFPHSEISGSKLVCSSPELIAACHVLHRLLMPRHSPCALISLTLVKQPFKAVFANFIIWIMQASEWFFANCYLLPIQLKQLFAILIKLKVSTILLKYCPLLLAIVNLTKNLHCSVFKVQFSNPKVRLKHSNIRLNASI